MGHTWFKKKRKKSSPDTVLFLLLFLSFQIDLPSLLMTIFCTPPPTTPLFPPLKMYLSQEHWAGMMKLVPAVTPSRRQKERKTFLLPDVRFILMSPLHPDVLINDVHMTVSRPTYDTPQIDLVHDGMLFVCVFCQVLKD